MLLSFRYPAFSVRWLCWGWYFRNKQKTKLTDKHFKRGISVKNISPINFPYYSHKIGILSIESSGSRSKQTLFPLLCKTIGWLALRQSTQKFIRACIYAAVFYIVTLYRFSLLFLPLASLPHPSSSYSSHIVAFVSLSFSLLCSWGYNENTAREWKKYDFNDYRIHSCETRNGRRAATYNR